MIVRNPPQPLSPAIGIALVGLLALGGCATAVTRPAIWPPPPDQGRVRFVRSFSQEGDISTGALGKIWRFLVPPTPGTQIRQPVGLAVSPDAKRLYVANGVRGNVVRVNLETGAFDVVASTQTRSAGRPMSVALDADENLYVADDSSSTIVVFGRDGAFLREFGREKLNEPKAIAIDRRGQALYVLNGMNRNSQAHRIDVFSLKGEHIRTIGKRGSAAGEFNYPSALAVGLDGRIYVADMLNFRIQVLDPDGTPVGTFGKLGGGQPGTFDKAKGIALDGFGNIYVTDGQQSFVQIFNSQFATLMGFGGRGNDPGFMMLPGAIAIDSRNHIFIGDTAAGRVSEYELFGTSAEDSFTPSPAPTPKGSPAAPQAPSGEKPQGG